MLTQKEITYLKENLDAEYLCIRKYEQYAALSTDADVKNMFTTLAGYEQQHATTLKNILTQNGVNYTSIYESYNKPSSAQNQQNLSFSDAQLMNDSLSTEKHVSSNYNTAILETVDTNIRKQLQHIQQEEQGHAETIFNMMRSKGYYKVE
ncbi:MAG: hypothetical protein KatS3mg079_216 [Caloramator sp.]|nr:MAG: hypothetical protein KatS3mg079_216 [Caloramator sp.]